MIRGIQKIGRSIVICTYLNRLDVNRCCCCCFQNLGFVKAAVARGFPSQQKINVADKEVRHKEIKKVKVSCLLWSVCPTFIQESFFGR